MREALAAWRDELRLAGQDGTAVSYWHTLARLRDHELAVDALTPAFCRAFLIERSRELAESSLLTLYYALRSFAGWLVDQRWLATNPTDGIPKPKQRRPVHLYKTAAQLRVMYQAATSDEQRLIMLLCGSSGLRSGEYLGLRWADVDFARARIRVLGKGRKWRELGPGALAFEVLNRSRAEASGPRVSSLTTAEGVRYHVRALARRAKVGPCTVHMLRHSFAIAWLERTDDAFTLQSLLGHSSTQMTSYYVRDVREKHAAQRQQAVDLGSVLFGE